MNIDPGDPAVAVPVHLWLVGLRVIQRTHPDRDVLGIPVLIANGRSATRAEAPPHHLARSIPTRLGRLEAEIRMLETIEHGKPATPFMKYGDTVRVEMLDRDDNSIFGAIDQTVAPVPG